MSAKMLAILSRLQCVKEFEVWSSFYFLQSSHNTGNLTTVKFSSLYSDSPQLEPNHKIKMYKNVLTWVWFAVSNKGDSSWPTSSVAEWFCRVRMIESVRSMSSGVAITMAAAMAARYRLNTLYAISLLEEYTCMMACTFRDGLRFSCGSRRLYCRDQGLWCRKGSKDFKRRKFCGSFYPYLL